MIFEIMVVTKATGDVTEIERRVIERYPKAMFRHRIGEMSITFFREGGWRAYPEGEEGFFHELFEDGLIGYYYPYRREVGEQEWHL